MELESNTRNLVTKEDFVKEISKTREGLIKQFTQSNRWMFVYWASQILAIAGLIFLYIKK